MDKGLTELLTLYKVRRDQKCQKEKNRVGQLDRDSVVGEGPINSVVTVRGAGENDRNKLEDETLGVGDIQKVLFLVMNRSQVVKVFYSRQDMYANFAEELKLPSSLKTSTGQRTGNNSGEAFQDEKLKEIGIGEVRGRGRTHKGAYRLSQWKMAKAKSLS